MTTQELLENLIQECQDDHVGLWRVVNAVRFDMAASTDWQIREMGLDVVRRLLAEPGLRVGHPARDGRHFIAWNLSPDESVSRIEQEWIALGRLPNIGEIAWFTKEC